MKIYLVADASGSILVPKFPEAFSKGKLLDPQKFLASLTIGSEISPCKYTVFN